MGNQNSSDVEPDFVDMIVNEEDLDLNDIIKVQIEGFDSRCYPAGDLFFITKNYNTGETVYYNSISFDDKREECQGYIANICIAKKYRKKGYLLRLINNTKQLLYDHNISIPYLACTTENLRDTYKIYGFEHFSTQYNILNTVYYLKFRTNRIVKLKKYFNNRRSSNVNALILLELCKGNNIMRYLVDIKLYRELEKDILSKKMLNSDLLRTCAIKIKGQNYREAMTSMLNKDLHQSVKILREFFINSNAVFAILFDNHAFIVNKIEGNIDILSVRKNDNLRSVVSKMIRHNSIISFLTESLDIIDNGISKDKIPYIRGINKINYFWNLVKERFDEVMKRFENNNILYR